MLTDETVFDGLISEGNYSWSLVPGGGKRCPSRIDPSSSNMSPSGWRWAQHGSWRGVSSAGCLDIDTENRILPDIRQLDEGEIPVVAQIWTMWRAAPTPPRGPRALLRQRLSSPGPDLTPSPSSRYETMWTSRLSLHDWLWRPS